MTARIKMNTKIRGNVLLRMVAMMVARATMLLAMAAAMAMVVMVRMATTAMM